ncbi:MAG: ankyrin repeat domain-containing protein [Opitutaceae bacterium]
MNETTIKSEIKRMLYRAIEAKNVCSALSILSEYPDLLTCYIGGDTVMHIAAECDCPELIAELVGLGCCPNALDEHGYPPIYFPCYEGYVQVVDTLLDHGADVEGLRPSSNGNFDQTTPLVCAARNGHLDLVKLLLNRGASVQVSDPRPIIEQVAEYPEIEKELRLRM